MKRKKEHAKRKLDGAVRLGRILDLFAKHTDKRGHVPDDEFLQGRSCGTCTQCCIQPAIRPIDLDPREMELVGPKKAGEACQHCTATGCAVYQERPDVCRSFECAYLSGLVDERPDETGVVWSLCDTQETMHIEGFGFRYAGQCANIDKALQNPVVRHQIRLLGSACHELPVLKIILTDADYQLGIDLTGGCQDSIVRQDYADPYAPKADMATVTGIRIDWYPEHMRRPDLARTKRALAAKARACYERNTITS